MKLNGKVVGVLVIMLMFSIFSLGSAQVTELNRNETLVVSGNLWGPPSSWNVLLGSHTGGTGGLVYETLFSYNPIVNEYTPWLAESGEWVSENDYIIKLRDGINWRDGVEFNADDLVFTYELARDHEIPYSPIWDWLDSVVAEDNLTVRFTFSEPRYDEWDSELYQRYIIPKHIFSEISSDELLTNSMREPVGTGSYLYHSAGQDRMIWERNDDWWGIEVFGEPTPKYIVDLVNQSNNIVMGMLMKGEKDLSNNFLPGIQQIKEQFNLLTWYEEEPYMIPWNTANMYMNTLVEPMDDSSFRRAMAFMVNKETIVDRVYDGLVEPANSTGLFGEAWLEYLDEEVVEEYGFEYNPEKSQSILDEAGYKDQNGDGWRQMPNGDPIELEIAVPSGWTDWMEAVRVISNNAEAVGVNITPSFPDYSLFLEKHQTRDFDMIIATFQTTLSSTPFDYWSGVANKNIHGDRIRNGNWGAYDNQDLFDMIDKFNMTRNETEKQELASEIQKTLLKDMPTVPAWHNGLWSQVATNYWNNWPTSDNPYGVPVTWGNTYQFGMVDVLIGIEAAE